MRPPRTTVYTQPFSVRNAFSFIKHLLTLIEAVTKVEAC